MGKRQFQQTRDDSSRQIRILFLAANPAETEPVDLEQELRDLEVELRGVKFRESISLTSKHAVRPDDLLRHVGEIKPTIIHFSGHGSRRGIVLRTDDGHFTEVSGASLRHFLEGRGVELLVLNACCTKEQGSLIGDAVPAIVGTASEVEDEAARRFTVAFYRTLGNGRSLADSFRDGRDAVILHGLQDVFWSSGDLNRVLCESTLEEGQTKPETWWRRFPLPIAFALTLLFVIAVVAWIRGWIGPTRTEFELTGATENWIRVHVTNRGPKASDLAGFRLKFTRLPIEDATLQIVGTDDAVLRLKANSEADVFLHAWELVTKCDPDTLSRPPFEKIEKSISGAGVTLGIEIRDAGGSAGKPRPGSRTFSAQRLYRFIEKRVSEYAHPCTAL